MRGCLRRSCCTMSAWTRSEAVAVRAIRGTRGSSWRTTHSRLWMGACRRIKPFAQLPQQQQLLLLLLLHGLLDRFHLQRPPTQDDPPVL